VTFANPWLLALVPVVLIITLLAERQSRATGIRFPTGRLLAGISDSFRVSLLRRLPLVRAASAVLLVLALARPQAVTEEKTTGTEGIDIVLCIDLSTSMLTEDFGTRQQRVSRIAAARDVMRDFVLARRNDRIGLVVFALDAYVVSPPTHDHQWLVENIGRLEPGVIDDGTAIGTGLMSALARLKGSTAKSRVVVLVTDGRNNAGDLSPDVAAEAARAMGVRVYSVGVGSKGKALYPTAGPEGRTIYRPVQADLDEKTLEAIASRTGARYFRASDGDSLRRVYDEIDALEKSRIEQKVYRESDDLYPLFLLPAVALLMLEVFLRQTVLRRIPC
jgi:Ca-activated chloride channel family protein